MSEATSGAQVPATVAGQLRVVPGFRSDERDTIVETLNKLDRQLLRFPAGEVDMELSVKERDTPSQQVTLECWIAKLPRFVATSRERDMQAALMDVREDLWRQIQRATDKRWQRGRR